MRVARARRAGALAAAVVLACALAACLCLAGCDDGARGAQTPVRGSVQEYSWRELSAIGERIAASGSEQAAREVAREYHLCNADGTLDGTQTKTFTRTDGSVLTVAICGFYHDARADGDGGMTGITFIATNSSGMSVVNNASYLGYGWEDSSIRALVVDDFVRSLPKELRGVIKPVFKQTHNVGSLVPGSAASVTTTRDYAFLFSAAELYGPTTLCSQGANDLLNQEGKQYQLFSDLGCSQQVDNLVLCRELGGVGCLWWTRSVNPDDSDSFVYVDTDGRPDAHGYVEYQCAVVPGFCL